MSGRAKDQTRASWVALLDAALDQPNPSRALRVAIRAVMARDGNGEETPGPHLTRPVRRGIAWRTLDALAKVQRGE